MTPRVSFIIPCFNLGEFLDEAVDSVFAQTVQDFEVVIVDDGSTDPATMARLDAWSRPRTRLVRSENRGLPAAKNLGLRHTTGPLVCMLDADDRLAPHYLERSIAALEADPDLSFASHWLRTFGDESWEWTPSSCEFPALLDVNTVNGSALVRRQALEAVGGFDESFREGCEDWDLWIGLVSRGYRGVIVPEFLFEYRRRHQSMSRHMLIGDGHPRLYRRLIEKHRDAFAAHLQALVCRRDRDAARLQLNLDRIAIHRYETLDPECLDLAERLASLRRPTSAASGRGPGWAEVAELARARAEVEELRRSLSWRVTAPLRSIADVLGVQVRPLSRRGRE